MAGIRMLEEQMQRRVPHTFNALAKLVMAMASVQNNAGQKTFLGRDKGQKAYAKFLSTLKATLHSMILDNLVTQATPSTEVTDVLEKELQVFALAFPHWRDAYGFAATFFGESRAAAVATIDRVRAQA